MTKNEFFRLLDKYLHGEANAEERELLEGFFDAQQQQRLASQWHLSEKEALKLKILYRINNSIDTDSGRKRTVFLSPFYGWAAAVAALLVAGWIILNQESPTEVNYLVQTTQPGQKMKVTLADGSVVHLNSASQLRYPQQFDTTRIIRLQGEAFFEVVKDKEKPFVVKTGDLKTRVLGTSFNINYYDTAQLKVTVASGKVEVSHDLTNQKDQILSVLEPGQQFTMIDSTIQVNQVNAELYTSWKDGFMHFEAVTLAELAVHLERWYGVQFLFENQELKKCRLNTDITGEPLMEMLKSLQIAGNINFRLRQDTVFLSGKGCNY